MDRAALKGQVAPVEEMAVQAKGNVPVDGEGEAKDTGDVGEAGAVGGEETCGNSSHKSAGGRTAERLARQYGGNEKTYRNAGRFVDNLAKLKCICPGFEETLASEAKQGMSHAVELAHRRILDAPI